jgi:hypothetical protein
MYLNNSALIIIIETKLLHTKFWSGNMKGSDHFEDERIILK